MSIQVGQELLHYRVTARIGAGGMGEHIAIKGVSNETGEREVYVERFPEPTVVLNWTAELRR